MFAQNPPVQVTNAGLSTLEGMSHMTRLRLTVAEPISDEGLGRLSSMTCLTTLLLSHLHKVTFARKRLVDDAAAFPPAHGETSD